MAARDPQTGQFVSGDTGQWEDIEVVSFQAGIGIEAADLAGDTGFNSDDGTTFEGGLLIDYDDVVDRNETLVLLRASHTLAAYINATQTADGITVCAAEVSASPSLSAAGDVRTATSDPEGIDDPGVVGALDSDDTIDLVGRPLRSVAGGPFSDGASGVGGAGGSAIDHETIVHPPRLMAEFHPRDELFLNGEIEVWNVDDAGVHLDLRGQHVYGVVSG